LIRIAVDPFPTAEQLAPLWHSAWGSDLHPGYTEAVLKRSLAHLVAYDGDRLVGFVNVAWDGGVHAFLLDTCVHADFRRRGIASELVRRAADLARERGAHWLHVDFEPHLEGFYRGCGFRPTGAGLIAL
jgi:GNAT superfamily N-acetyltransferase